MFCCARGHLQQRTRWVSPSRLSFLGSRVIFSTLRETSKSALHADPQADFDSCIAWTRKSDISDDLRAYFCTFQPGTEALRGFLLMLVLTFFCCRPHPNRHPRELDEQKLCLICSGKLTRQRCLPTKCQVTRLNHTSHFNKDSKKCRTVKQ